MLNFIKYILYNFCPVQMTNVSSACLPITKCIGRAYYRCCAQLQNSRQSQYWILSTRHVLIRLSVIQIK